MNKVIHVWDQIQRIKANLMWIRRNFHGNGGDDDGDGSGRIVGRECLIQLTEQGILERGELHEDRFRVDCRVNLY